MARKTRHLTEEDRILWNEVARTVTPIKGRKEPELAETPAAAGSTPKPSVSHEAPGSAGSPPQTRQVRRHHYTLQPIDKPLRRKLARGRLPIEARVDLHGLAQAEANILLLGFLSRAQERGMRHVLVITGKGSSVGSEGALKRAVPHWLATRPFRRLISGYESAAREHGGEGALYLRLRKRSGERG